MGERALTAAPPGRGVRPWMVLGVGIVAVSTGSILVRLAEAPPLAVGAWRLTLASVLLAPWAAGPVRREGPLLARREWLGVCLAGLALAVHFGTWIASLAYTTVASSVILVSTTPLFVGLASHYLLGERLSRRRTLAIAVALVGAAIVGYGDLAASGEALLGDLLALTGAVAMSAYLLLGRRARRKLSTLAYIWPCYSVAGLTLLVVCLLARQPLGGYTLPTYLALAALAVGPQILGHSSFNWALAHFSAVTVTLVILAEPVGATLLAALILGEAPRLPTYIGGPLILLGIYMASREEPGS